MPRRNALVALLLALAACSSPPALPVAEYFPAVESELSRLDQATRDLTDRYAVELEAEIGALVAEVDLADPAVEDQLLADVTDAARAKMRTIIESHTAQVEVFADRVGDLVPPDAIAGEHDELIAAFTSWANSAEATVVELEAAAAFRDLAHALQRSAFADAQLRVDEACRGLLDDAEAAGVSLTCPGTDLDALDVGTEGEASPPTSAPSRADCPEVIAVDFVETSPGVFTVSATVRSVDIEGVSYADAWEVRAPDGTVLGTRILTHPHPNEQPFTRSLGDVPIGPDITTVDVAARDSARGFCGEALRIEVPRP